MRSGWKTIVDIAIRNPYDDTSPCTEAGQGLEHNTLGGGCSG